jgi:hypothetical protein
MYDLVGGPLLILLSVKYYSCATNLRRNLVPDANATAPFTDMADFVWLQRLARRLGVVAQNLRVQFPHGCTESWTNRLACNHAGVPLSSHTC